MLLWGTWRGQGAITRLKSSLFLMGGKARSSKEKENVDSITNMAVLGSLLYPPLNFLCHETYMMGQRNAESQEVKDVVVLANC